MIRMLTRLAGVVLLVTATMWLASPARADLYSASSEYKRGDYAHALTDFLELAQLGQAQAQLDLAIMYRTGQGVVQSDIHAYAWAMVSSQNGDTDAKKLADEIRPELAPGSERVAGWITAPYTRAALSQSLLPISVFETRDAAVQYWKWVAECRPVRVYKSVYPDDAKDAGMEGNVFVAYTLMPDGRARVPRVILEVPPGVFGAATRKSILLDGFAPLPPGSAPIHCVSFYRYVMGPMQGSADYPRLSSYVDTTRQHAAAGDPNSELVYGMLLVGLPQLGKSSNAGLPWFLRAAQGGLPQAQFEVGYSLLMGLGCERDEVKALKWLRLAADQNEPNAEVTLAMGAMKGSPKFGDVAQAKSWLEKAAAQGNHDGELYLAALLAAAPDFGLRDPQRALDLLQAVFHHVDEDPAAFEISAAAQAAEGDFADAVRSENKAIRRARSLQWDVSSLQARLATYQAGKAWYGDLLDF